MEPESRAAPDPDEILRQAQEAKPVPTAEEVLAAHPREDEPLYEQSDPVCTLTLDKTQAWWLGVILHPYREADAEMWEPVLAVNDIHRRLTEAVNFKRGDMIND